MPTTATATWSMCGAVPGRKLPRATLPSPLRFELLKDMGMPPLGLLRQRGTPSNDLKLDDPKWTDSELIAAMAKHSVLIERLVVRTARVPGWAGRRGG